MRELGVGRGSLGRQPDVSIGFGVTDGQLDEKTTGPMALLLLPIVSWSAW